MTEENQNFEIWQGDDLQLTFAVEGVDSLEGVNIRWGYAPLPGGAPLAVKTIASGIAVSGTTFTVTLEPPDTLNARPGNYFHEAEISDDTQTRTIAIGTMTIRPAILKESP